MFSEEQALQAELESRVKEALKKHGLEEVLKYLHTELWQLECSTLYSTKGGLLGTPDYDELNLLIKITKQVIAKLENGKIKPPPKLQQGPLMTLFKRKHIQLILQGRKTQTCRKHKREWRLGKVYAIKDNWFGKPKAHILITRKFRQRLGDISPEDVKKEGYNRLEEFRRAWQEIHGSWNTEENVMVYEFKLTQKTSTKVLLQDYKNSRSLTYTKRRRET